MNFIVLTAVVATLPFCLLICLRSLLSITEHNTATAQQNKTKQNKTKQNKTQHNKTRQNTTKHDKTKQNTTKQNKTKQNKTKQNKTLTSALSGVDEAYGFTSSVRLAFGVLVNCGRLSPSAAGSEVLFTTAYGLTPSSSTSDTSNGGGSGLATRLLEQLWISRVIGIGDS